MHCFEAEKLAFARRVRVLVKRMLMSWKRERMRAPRLMAPEDMTKTMNVGLLDSLLLREHLQLGVDVVLAHRLAEGEPLHGDQVGRVQDLIAARVRGCVVSYGRSANAIQLVMGTSSRTLVL